MFTTATDLLALVQSIRNGEEGAVSVLADALDDMGRTWDAAILRGARPKRLDWAPMERKEAFGWTGIFRWAFKEHPGVIRVHDVPASQEIAWGVKDARTDVWNRLKGGWDGGMQGCCGRWYASEAEAMEALALAMIENI